MWRPNSSRGVMWRGFVSCVALYAIALELVLSGFIVVSTMASASAGSSAEICVTAAPGSHHASSDGVGHHAMCRCGPACTMSACAAVMAAAAASAAIFRLTAGGSSPPCPPQTAGLARAMAAGPHSPRAPPAI